MRVYSIYPSIDGEVNGFHQGIMTTFIRLAGCNLSCVYCDTKYAQSNLSGKNMTIDAIIDKVKLYPSYKVTITGGEPLLQKEQLYELVCKLVFEGYFISIETNGSIDLFKTGYRVVGSWIVDYKLRSSGMRSSMNRNIYKKLIERDFVKFVIGDKNDFDEAVETVDCYIDDGCRAQFAFSPCFGLLPPAELYDWMEKEKLSDIILNLQLHKYIWPDKKNEER